MAPAKPTFGETQYVVIVRTHPPPHVAQLVSQAHAKAIQSKWRKNKKAAKD